MKKLLQFALLAALVFGATATMQAQKFGYVNAAKILSEHPDVKAAESNLEGLRKQLQKKGQAMVEKFQADYVELEKQARAGTLAPAVQQEETGKLEARQEEIAKFEQEMIASLQKKRAELMEPILAKVNDAIEAVAKEGGFLFIFDQQTLLYGQESADVSNQVKAKLNL